MTTVTEALFLGRQPILDGKHNLIGYELLFRSGAGNSANISDDVAATATVINNAFNEIGIDSVLGPYQGYLNMNESLLMSDFIEVLPRNKVVLEILETVTVSDALIERCKQLRKMKFRLALDDVSSFDESLAPLLEYIDVVKIDLVLVPPENLKGLIKQFRQWPVKLLAEKVETSTQFDHCLELGFSIFQGYHFARPHIITGKRFSHSELSLMKLLGLVLGDADSHEIEKEIKSNPVLSMNLLKLSNSAGCGASTHITSIMSAITILGRRQLRRWVQILLYSQAGRGGSFPNPLLQLAATRGKLMERIAARKNDVQLEERAFIAGIMSLMDTLLSVPLPEVIQTLPLCDEVKAALLGREGELGKMLNLIEHLEMNDTEQIEKTMQDFPYLTLQNLSDAHAEALAWSNNIT